MGGVITVAVRFSDGLLRTQEAWTNTTPFWLKTPQVAAGDEAFLRSFLDSPARDFKEPVPFAPTEHGLIVVDCLTHNLVEMSDYTTLRHFHPLEITREVMRGDGAYARQVALTEFLARKRLTIGKSFRRNETGEVLSDEPAEPLTRETLVTLLEECERQEADRRALRRRILIDWSPWTLRSFQWRGIGEGSGTVEDCRSHLAALGFDVSHADWNARHDIV